MKTHKRIATVIPVYNEEEIVDSLIDRLVKACDPLEYEFVFVFVDDGSQDKTLKRLVSRQDEDNRLMIVKLSRNWGQQNAFNAGLDMTKNLDVDAVILMDGDLEDPPELIPTLISEWEGGADVVLTVKKTRQIRLTRRILTTIYYKLLNSAGERTTPEQAGMFSLVNKKALSEIRRFTEHGKSYPNLRTFIGFNQKIVPYDREKRYAGPARQSLIKLLNDGLNAIISTSLLPIRIFTILGILLFIILMISSFALVVLRLMDLGPLTLVPGWTSTIVLLLILFSVQIVFMGVIGEYMARIYIETRGRPNYIIDEVIAPFYKAEDDEKKDADSKADNE